MAQSPGASPIVAVGQTSLRADDLEDRLRVGLANRYRIDREVGRGGMATVYLAEDLKHGRPVAIKVLRPELAALVGEPARFLTEIRIAARLNHPHILPLHDSGECDGMLYYVTPFMGCQSLRGRLEREPQLPIDEALRITQGVAAALDYAHRHDVVHRDIKPENILLHEGHPIVADFGIARAIWALRSRPGPADVAVEEPVVGTADYMSPEQAGGDRAPDGRSDQYSLACVLYEMLAGRPPFGSAGSRGLGALAGHVTQPVPPISQFRPDVPAPVEHALLKALAKEPAERFATTGEFAASLVTPLSGLGPIARGGRPRSRAIAVLPFLNASREPESEYLSDGITDELITALAAVEGLEVVPRSSAFALKDRRDDVRAIGDLLGVATVLEGTVQRSGPRLRITVRLTDAMAGRHLWSARYDGSVDDVFTLQDEIARSVVGTLRRTVLDGLADPAPRRYTSNVKAYQLYLRGRYFWNRRTAGDTARAIEYFGQAIAEDPGYALAYTGLADSYALAVDYRSAPVGEGMRRAKAEALRALALDDTLAEAHTSLAWVTFIHEWDWVAAGREFRRAIELDPRYPTARQWHAWYLMAMGRVDDALVEGRAAAQLDPASVSARRSVGWLHTTARRPEAAIEHLRRALVMDPTAWESHLILGRAYAQRGAYDQATAAIREAIAGSDEHPNAVAELGVVAAMAGRADEAQRTLDTLTERATRQYVSPVNFVTLATVLGDRDAAFTGLERAYEERRGWLAYLKVEPAFDALRADPRFARLVERMRLP